MAEQRRDPTLGTWCVISESRAHRPIPLVLPALAKVAPESCPFCPGHEAATPPTLASLDDEDGAWRVRAFPNRYPALTVEGRVEGRGEGPFDVASGVGAHEVIVESPHHDRPLWTDPEHAGLAMQLAQARLADLSRDRRMVHLAWFRNHGALAGASQTHPHSQVLAGTQVPRDVAEMVRRGTEHRDRRGRALLDDVLAHELDRGVRVLSVQDGLAAVCAFAPRFPFETWILPLQGGPRFREAGAAMADAVGRRVAQVVAAMATVLDRPAHNVTLYEAPRGGERGFRWHLRISPRLVGVGGFEVLGGGTIVHTAPEQAATLLTEAMRGLPGS